MEVFWTPASQSQPPALDRRPRSAEAQNRGQDGAFSRREPWGFEERQQLKASGLAPTKPNGAG